MSSIITKLTTARENLQKALTDGDNDQIVTLTGEVEELTKQAENAARAETLLKNITGMRAGTNHAAATIGEHFVKALAGRGKLGSGQTFEAPEYVAAAQDVQVTPAAGTDGLNPAQWDGIWADYRPELVSRRWLGQSKTGASSITYHVDKMRQEGNPGTVAENTAAPHLHFTDLEKVTELVHKLSAILTVSEELLEDSETLAGYINGKLVRAYQTAEDSALLFGTGTGGQSIKGVAARTGVQAYSAKIGGLADLILDTRSKITNATGLLPDGIIINPADWAALRLQKDTAGQYYGGSAFGTNYGTQIPGGVPTLWGVRVLETPTIPAGTVLMGAGKDGATVYTRKGVTVTASRETGDNFTHDRVSLKISSRLALAVERPEAFAKLTITPAG